MKRKVIGGGQGMSDGSTIGVSGSGGDRDVEWVTDPRD